MLLGPFVDGNVHQVLDYLRANYSQAEFQLHLLGSVGEWQRGPGVELK